MIVSESKQLCTHPLTLDCADRLPISFCSGRQYPCVLIRTPYNKNKENPDLRNPGLYWTQNSFACFIQDVRGRFASEGTFYKYTGEAEDGYDTVQWIAEQPWCNGSVATEGPSYLTHVQTSMALLRPPALKAMFANKGGFFSAFTSGVRNGGAYEARQWVWGVKNASRKNPVTKAALEHVESCFGDWMKRSVDACSCGLRVTRQAPSSA